MKRMVQLMSVLVTIGATCGCDPGTPLGDVMHPAKTQDANITVTNKGSAPANVIFGGSESLDEDQCNPDYLEHKADTLAVGESKPLTAQVKCPLGEYRWFVDITVGKNHKQYYYRAEHLAGSIQCDDSSCDAKLTCDGGECKEIE